MEDRAEHLLQRIKLSRELSKRSTGRTHSHMRILSSVRESSIKDELLLHGFIVFPP
ncbi:hypothetical protein WUBG_12366 [Wuchereria bancrofti]|uniref:Uncharacterized protein n=1 Tax=Wuchereria bancrofti TaxID=6293 RepID=J9EN22_WUCBA|nr:hypothetical protein WUBG_12366 [Wuchereria bancrofti]